MYSTALQCTAQYCTAQYSTTLHCTTLHSTALHSTALHSAARHSTAQHCTTLNSSAHAAHCTALHTMIVAPLHCKTYSLSARILHRAPPPAPSGSKFSNSENCCGSENAMPPKIFWGMEGHRGHFRSKNVFFSKNIFWKKFIINHTIFLNFRYAFFRY